MKSLFLKSILSLSLALCALVVYGQDAETAAMLMKSINTHLANGNCEKAQSAYDSWKAYTNSTNSSVERRIKSCQDTKKEQVSQNKNYIELKTAGIMVQTKDVTEYLGVYWEDAKSLCDNSIVGGYTNWRLPTNNELRLIYMNKDKVGGFNGGKDFMNYDYWSSNKKNMYDYHDIVSMLNGSSSNNIYSSARCRCVRDLNERTLSVGMTYQGGHIAYLDKTGQHGLIITIKSHYPTSWSTAFAAGDGNKDIGRLPLKDELLLIYQNRSKLGLYKEYWSYSSVSIKNGSIIYAVNYADGKTYEYTNKDINKGKKLFYFIISDF
jgi:hypothetical protein